MLKPWLFAIALSAPGAIAADILSGIDKSAFDPAVRIQDNLYQAVNGAWLQKTEIPADQARWGAISEMRSRTEHRVRELIKACAAKPDDATKRQIADLYASYMDEARVEQLGIAPLQPLLDAVAALQSRTDLLKLMGDWQALGINLPLNLSLSQDADDARQYLLSLHQGGLGLPDRDYYLGQDERFSQARQAYRQYLHTLFVQSGSKPEQAGAQADAVLALEGRLAKLHWSRVESRDVQKTHNKRDRAGLAALSPALDWAPWLDAAGAATAAKFNITQPSYVSALAELIGKGEPLDADLAVWRDYLRARLLDHFAALLPKTFVDARFAYREQTLAGAKSAKPRYKHATAMAEAALGEALGRLYVERHFNEASKARMEVMVANLIKAYDQSIDQLKWMSPATKAAARQKLAQYGVKIGYPSQWRDDGGLDIRADDLIGNAMRSARFDYRYKLGKLGKPVDRAVWHMTPQTVNAYYSQSMNEIVFPAAFLQEPYFNAAADDAANYGAIGSVIGHEISHGFDSRGSQFDGDGNLRNWWQSDDRQAFDALTSQLVRQYDGYMPIANRHINGQLTLGENIADLSGMQIAFKAYQLSLNGKPAPVIDGFTGEQRFFIGFAQARRDKRRDETMLQQLTTDPHSPSEFRAIGVAVNSDAFMNAFDVKPGDGMYKPAAERLRIW
ncbi:M13 family metallopeptidase [Chitinimonas sp.]|uniref:M13 family metallopeptidase n=1 Tax=Chitinimonas sp. TaxID=1934313 RepID=UPI0035AED266